MKLLIILILAPLLFAQKDHFLEINAESTIKEKADIIIWTFRVRTVSPELDDAKEKNDRIIEKLGNKLVAKGLKRKDLVLNNSNQGKEYDYRERERVLLGYYFDRTFFLKLNKIRKFDQISDLLTQDNNIEVFNMTYDSSKKESLKIKAMEEASKNAKKKAEVLAKSLNLKLGTVIAVSEISNSLQLPGPYYKARAMEMSMDSSSGAKMSAEHTGYIEVSYKMNVRFSIK